PPYFFLILFQSDLLLSDFLFQPGQYMAHHKKDCLIMNIIQDILVPHKLQYCREFFIRIPELEDCRQKRKNIQPAAYISYLLRDPSQFFTGFCQFSCLSVKKTCVFLKNITHSPGRKYRSFQTVQADKFPGEMAVRFRIAEYIIDRHSFIIIRLPPVFCLRSLNLDLPGFPVYPVKTAYKSNINIFFVTG